MLLGLHKNRQRITRSLLLASSTIATGLSGTMLLVAAVNRIATNLLYWAITTLVESYYGKIMRRRITRME